MTLVAFWLALPFQGSGDGSAKRARDRARSTSAMQTNIPAADLALLERIRAGDVPAFESLFTMHWTSLCTVAALYTHDMAEAEEIVATIFADMWERRATLQITVKLRTYLHAAVKHRTVNWRRDQSRRNTLIQRAADEVPGMGERVPTPVTEVEQRESFARVVQSINALPDRYRLAFVYRWNDGWEYADIAAALGISVNAAQTLVSRAIKMIRARLGE